MATYSGDDKKLQYLFNRTQDMTGATASSYGTAGVVPAPEPGDENKYLKGDGTWDSVDEVEVAQKLTKTETVVAVDTEPYLSRTALMPEGASGYIREKLIGGCLAWNQNVQNGNFADTSNWNRSSSSVVTISAADNELTVTTTTDGNYHANQSPEQITGHKYLFSCDAYSSYLSNLIVVYTGAGDSASTRLQFTNTETDAWVTYAGIYERRDINASQQIRLVNRQSASANRYRNVQLFDLTLMFGSEVADAIYAMEQAEEGAGVAWFRNYFPNDYYAYDTGSIQPVTTSGKTVTKDGHIHDYPLSAVRLYGIPTWADGKLNYDGDEYASGGEVTRKCGIVDLGALTWTYNSTSGWFQTTLTGRLAGADAKARSAKYAYYGTGTSSALASDLPDKELGFYRTTEMIVIRDSAYTDAAAFTTAVSGVYLVYELATPTTETAEPFQNPQFSDGAEAFTDTRIPAVPVGHYTEYMGATDGEYIQAPTMPIDSGKFVLTTDGKEVLWEKPEKPQEIYSTEEQAIGKWIDGRTLYKRTYTLLQSDFTDLGNDQYSYTLDFGVRDLIDVEAFFIDGGANVNLYPNEYLTQISINIGWSPSILYFMFPGIGRLSLTRYLYLTIKYTKR